MAKETNWSSADFIKVSLQGQFGQNDITSKKGFFLWIFAA